MNVMFDTNVILDVLLERDPFVDAAAKLFALVDIDFSDYEEAVLHEAGRAVGATAIVTRDRRGFQKSAIPALDPQELLAAIAASS